VVPCLCFGAKRDQDLSGQVPQMGVGGISSSVLSSYIACLYNLVSSVYLGVSWFTTIDLKYSEVIYSSGDGSGSNTDDILGWMTIVCKERRAKGPSRKMWQRKRIRVFKRGQQFMFSCTSHLNKATHLTLAALSHISAMDQICM